MTSVAASATTATSRRRRPSTSTVVPAPGAPVTTYRLTTLMPPPVSIGARATAHPRQTPDVFTEVLFDVDGSCAGGTRS